MYYSPRLRLKIPFPGLDQVSRNYSQAFQDIFVLSALGGKREGFFLEIGASDPVFISNTYLLESKFNWRGISIEINPSSARRFARKRTSTLVEADALQIDYLDLLRSAGAPERVDYLQVDIDPSAQSLQCLKLIPFNNFRFSVITFETDFYDPNVSYEEKVAIRDGSRELLRSHGYALLGAGIGSTGPADVFEDWWVDPQVVPGGVIESLRKSGEFNDSGERFLSKGPNRLGIEFFHGQGLGNQLWTYGAARTFAELRGLDLEVLGLSRFKGSNFLDLDFGSSSEVKGHSREARRPKRLPSGYRFYKRERKLVSTETGVDVSGFDNTFSQVPINTLIDGNFQSYTYLAGYEDKLRDWIRPRWRLQPLGETTCVIHVRAGDFVGIPHVRLGVEYYQSAISHMRNMGGATEFLCISDQPEVARSLLPEEVKVIEPSGRVDTLKAAHHHGGPVEDDFTLLMRAKKLIISNSSFAWWGAFLNPNSPEVLAPKYWSNHGGATEEWSTADVATPGFDYVGRDGTVQSYIECIAEIRAAATPDSRVVEAGAFEDFGSRRFGNRVRDYFRRVYHLASRS